VLFFGRDNGLISRRHLAEQCILTYRLILLAGGPAPGRLDRRPLENFNLALGVGGERLTKKSRLSEQQIAQVLRQATEGLRLGRCSAAIWIESFSSRLSRNREVCRKAKISDASFYAWRKKYARLLPSEMNRLKQLEEENQRSRSWLPTYRSPRRCCRGDPPKCITCPVRARVVVVFTMANVFGLSRAGCCRPHTRLNAWGLYLALLRNLCAG